MRTAFLHRLLPLEMPVRADDSRLRRCRGCLRGRFGPGLSAQHTLERVRLECVGCILSALLGWESDAEIARTMGRLLPPRRRRPNASLYVRCDRLSFSRKARRAPSKPEAFASMTGLGSVSTFTSRRLPSTMVRQPLRLAFHRSTYACLAPFRPVRADHLPQSRRRCLPDPAIAPTP